MGDHQETDRTAMIDAPAAPVASAQSGASGPLARRWPTALALLVSAPSFGGPQTPDGVHALAEAMLLLPLWYVVIAAVARRSWTWFVLVGVIGLFVLLRLQDLLEPAAVLMAVALAAVLWGAVHGRLVQPSFLLQVAGLVAFAALAVAGFVLAPDVGHYLSPPAGSRTGSRISPTCGPIPTSARSGRRVVRGRRRPDRCPPRRPAARASVAPRFNEVRRGQALYPIASSLMVTFG